MAEISSSVLWDCLLNDLRYSNGTLLEGFRIDEANRSVAEPPGCSPRQYAAAALLRSIVKKFQDEIDQEAADKAAWELFHTMNDRCKDWELRTDELGPYDDVVVGHFKKAVYDFFTVEGYPLIDEAKILPHVDFGPGSGPGADRTDFVTKIGQSRLTASSPLIVQLFDGWVRDHSTRLDCEIARSLAFGSPEIVEAVNITAVPKTAKISRLVKPEPLLNMFFQKGVQEVLEDRLRELYHIDLSDQDLINQDLARKGSITGDYSTVDLSSASDTISLGLCRALIPRADFTWLNLLRSKKAISDRGVVELHMMATMGNAFCFPLETAIFACAVDATYRALGIPLWKKRRTLCFVRDEESKEVTGIQPRTCAPNFGVFGDDIVVREEAYDTLCRLLRALGFLPNMEKSFTRRDGSFRESCGADYIYGVNVRGVYATSLKRMQDRMTLINGLVDWSARTRIYLPVTIELLMGGLPAVPVPPWENPDSGIRVPLACISARSKVYRAVGRGDSDYQGSYLYKRYVPVSRDFSLGADESVETPNTTRMVYWNSSAIFMAAVKGHARSGRISVRMYEVRYKKRLGVAPCWDYMPPRDSRYGYRQDWYSIATAYFGTKF
ncbi:TPA_asm: RNA-directed RNA polymerase [ssRNA phage SRR7976357_2]|uniref:RNA-directed RNA polymerase n=1 Tax=ssRNA phage SRR7976357_2 TaxID=2786742 RepID=A0A8S5L5Q8_9VIRU|nr:RNA-directed RNA polymerase [ssRNA phage SRR7976357_2]DAD52815.1 TPA_asm: RNA-directed RNA polymerase [ssRNA phage SRR7976357_2]